MKCIFSLNSKYDILHELFNDNNINIGKRFAILISGFIFYYIIWFGLFPLSIYQIDYFIF